GCGGALIESDGLHVSMDHLGRLTATITVGDGACDQGETVTVTAGTENVAALYAPLYSDVVPRSRWTYASVTWDGKNLELLLNGSVVASESIVESTPLSECASTLALGGGETGALRHVSLFGAALEPDAPHQDLAKGTVPLGAMGDLLAYWPLDEGAGKHALDVSGHGNHGLFTLKELVWVEAAKACVPGGPPICAPEEDPTPAVCLDTDQDGLTPFQGDCNDGPDGAAMAWGAEEICDGIDNNCDGYIDMTAAWPPLLDGYSLSFPEDCGDLAICQGTLGCVSGPPCASPTFTDDDDGDPSSSVGVDVYADLSLGGSPGATVATWYKRQGQPWYKGWAVSTPTLRLRVNGHGETEAYVRFEDDQDGCTAEWEGAVSRSVGVFPAPYVSGDWNFVAVTWDGMSLQIWNNGMEAMTLALSDTPRALESGCGEVTTMGYRIVDPDENVGWANEGDALPAYGTMRHVSLWSTVLSPEALQALAQGNLPPQDLEGYWPLDEGGGEVARDISGHGQDGIYLGGLTWQDNTACLPAGELLCTGAEETWDPVCKDGDADTYTGLAGDCDDDNDVVNPGAPEICDGVDNDCDGVADPVSLCCGNGVVDPLEGCDDLNQDDDDGCSAICQPEGLVLAGELVHHETFDDGLPEGAETVDGDWPTAETDQGTTEVDGRTCWQQRSDWSYLQIPGPPALDGDDAFLVEVDVWRPADVTWSHWQFYPAEGSHTDDAEAGLSTHLTQEVVHQVVKNTNGDVVFDEALANTAAGGSWVRLRAHVRRSNGETRVWLNGVYQGVFQLGPQAYTGQDVVLSGGGCAPGVDGCPAEG
ncbi:MAG: MopE-related protein, partial [Myxococcota bacterium]|nr:MopE-related protein [Myxococcota bacterium]